MPRPHKLWYWKARDTYCVKINNVRHILGADKKAAEKEFHRLLCEEEGAPEGSVAAIADEFLRWTAKHQPASFSWYEKYIVPFAESLPNNSMPVNQLTEDHVEAFVERDEWGDSTRRGAITAILRCLNWAEKKKKIGKNPIRGMKKPPMGSREEYITPPEYKTILKHVKGGFRTLVEMAWNTGARPRELLNVRAAHVDLENSRWVFKEKESKGKKRKRIVDLNDKALKATKELMKQNPTGTLLRNDFSGEAWSPFAVTHRFVMLEKKIGKRHRLYDFRFSFCTNGLKRGVDPVTMQHLLGHTDLSMISKIYALVSQDVEHMREAAKKAAK